MNLSEKRLAGNNCSGWSSAPDVGQISGKPNIFTQKIHVRHV